MAKRKNSVAYVRLDGNNTPIPGTLIFRQKKPYGRFAKLIDPYGDLCCGAPRNSCGSRYSQDAVSYVNPEITIDSFTSVATDADAFCNVYTVYRLVSPDISFNGAMIVEKRDSSNTVLWSKRLEEAGESPLNPYPSMIKLDGNGDAVIVYSSAIVKLSGADGSVIWAKQYVGGTFSAEGDIWIDWLSAINFDSNNDVYVGGRVMENELLPPPAGYMVQNKYGLVLKLDGTDGTILSSNYVDVTTRDVPAYNYQQDLMEIQVAYDDSLRLVFNYGDNNGEGDQYTFVVAKLTSGLSVVWSKELKVPIAEDSYAYASTIVVDNEGSTICPTEDGFVFKLDEDGNVIWLNKYLDENDNYLGEVGSIDDNGNVMLSWGITYNSYQARSIAKLSGATGAVMFYYFIAYPGENMSYWYGYTPRQSNFIRGGDTLYMCSYNYQNLGWVEKFPVNQSIPNGTYENYVVGSYAVTVTPRYDLIFTKDITLTSFVVPTFNDYLINPVDDTNIVHTITNIP